MNPYQILRKKIEALLAIESKLAPEERKQNEWLLTVRFADTQIVVGKGDVNTMFYAFGDGARKLCYPDELLSKLYKLEKQPFARYKVASSGKILFSETAACKSTPKGVIIGIAADGSEKVAFRAKANLKGMEWVKT